MISGSNNTSRNEINCLFNDIIDIDQAGYNDANSILDAQQRLSDIDRTIQSIAPTLLANEPNPIDEDTARITALKQLVTQAQDALSVRLEILLSETNNSNKRVSDDDDVAEFQSKMLKTADDDHREWMSNSIAEAAAGVQTVDRSHIDGLKRKLRDGAQLLHLTNDSVQKEKILTDVIGPLGQLLIEAMGKSLVEAETQIQKNGVTLSAAILREYLTGYLEDGILNDLISLLPHEQIKERAALTEMMEIAASIRGFVDDALATNAPLTEEVRVLVQDLLARAQSYLNHR